MQEVLSGARFWRDHHWAPSRLSDYVDGAAAARQRARVERHVGECGDCRRLAAGPKLLVDGLHRLPALEGGGALRVAASVRKRLREPPACDLNRATESAGQTGHE